jgi:hypothetical protein
MLLVLSAFYNGRDLMLRQDETPRKGRVKWVYTTALPLDDGETAKIGFALLVRFSIS